MMYSYAHAAVRYLFAHPPLLPGRTIGVHIIVTLCSDSKSVCKVRFRVLITVTAKSATVLGYDIYSTGHELCNTGHGIYSTVYEVSSTGHGRS
jgi:hypothetical protein